MLKGDQAFFIRKPYLYYEKNYPFIRSDDSAYANV